jgi:hypothetical protein
MVKRENRWNGSERCDVAKRDESRCISACEADDDTQTVGRTNVIATSMRLGRGACVVQDAFLSNALA